MPNHSKIKVLFIVKLRKIEGMQSKSYGLVNSCNFVVNALKEQGVEAENVTVVDGNCIDRELHRYRPTHCFIEALWVTPLKMEILCNLYPNTKFFIRIHSMTPFLVSEGIAYQWLSEYAALQRFGHKIFLSANNERMVSDLRTVFKGEVVYSPNIYNPKDLPVAQYIGPSDSELHIGCFGALRPLKNHCTQAIWALKFAEQINRQLHFHVNLSEAESQTASPILRNLRSIFSRGSHKLIEHSWLDHRSFLQLVDKMDIGMQVSFTETFNIVAADFVAMGRPVVVSPEIDWIITKFMCSPTEELQALKVLDYAFQCNSTGKHLNNKKYLQRFNKSSCDIWMHELNNCITR